MANAADVNDDAINLTDSNVRATVTVQLNAVVTSAGDMYDAAANATTRTMDVSSPPMRFAIHAGYTRTGVFAYDQVALDAPEDPYTGTVAYFTAGDGRAYAVDARTGARRWSTGVSEGGGYRSHEVCGAVLLANNGPVDILDRATGRRRGKLLRDGDAAGQMAVADGFVYVSSRNGIHAFDCRTLGG